MPDDFSVVSWYISWQLYRLAHRLAERFPRYSLTICRVIATWNAKSSSVLKQRLAARASVTEALLTGQLGDRDRSTVINQRVVTVYRRSSDPELRTHVAWAMTNRGLDLVDMGRPEEAIAVFEDLAAFVPAEYPYLGPLAQGLNNWAAALNDIGRHDEEMAMYERVAAVLRDRGDDPELAHLLAWSLVSKGIELASRHKYAAAVEVFDEVLHKWWTSRIRGPSDRLQEAIAASLRHRSAALVALNQHVAAMADANRAIDRYVGSGTVGIQQEVAWAMLGKAVALEEIGHRAESLETCQSLVKRYGRSVDKQVAEAVSRARRFSETVIGA